MANHVSAQKRTRRNAKRSMINTSRTSRMRTFIKRVEVALAGGNAKDAEAALKDAQPEIMRGVAKGILHKNTASRKISRLSARIKAIK